MNSGMRRLLQVHETVVTDSSVAMPPHPRDVSELVRYPKEHLPSVMLEKNPNAKFYVHNSTLLGKASPMYYTIGNESVILAVCCDWDYQDHGKAYWPLSGGCMGSC